MVKETGKIENAARDMKHSSLLQALASRRLKWSSVHHWWMALQGAKIYFCLRSFRWLAGVQVSKRIIVRMEPQKQPEAKWQEERVGRSFAPFLYARSKWQSVPCRSPPNVADTRDLLCFGVCVSYFSSLNSDPCRLRGAMHPHIG